MSDSASVPLGRLAEMRVNYGERYARLAKFPELTEASLSDGWEPLLRNWIDDAVAEQIVEANAMVVATVDDAGYPDARTVLCKEVRAEGVVFFTNYDSDKARQLAAVPYAALTFTWPAMERQVRLRGPVVRVTEAETADYWRGRPRGSQLGAWASQQSRPIGSRAELEAALVDVGERFAVETEIPVPEHWGGYLVAAHSVEFWQGRADRLHNRIRVTYADGIATVERLQP